MKKRKFLALMLALAMTVSMLVGCGSDTEPAEAEVSSTENTEEGSAEAEIDKDAVVTIAVTSGWDSLSPLASTTQIADYVCQTMFENLVSMNDEGQYEPRLAESWEVAEDFTSVTFKLQEKAVWHDGEPLNADDVMFTVDLLADPELVTARRLLLQGVAGTDDLGVELSEGSVGVEKIDEYTVKFNFKQPMALSTFFKEYTSFFVLPEHLLKDIAPAEILASDFWMNPVGCGPFVFESQVPGESVTLTSNPDYYLGAPQFAKLVIKKMAAANLLSAVMSGEVDLLPGSFAALPAADYDMCAAVEGYTTVSQEACSMQCILINNKQIPDARVRRAFEMLVDKQAIVDSVYSGRANIMDSYYMKANNYYNEEIVKEYGTGGYNPEAAVELLKEANFDFSTPLKFLTASGTGEQTAVIIQQSFAEAGLNLEIQLVDMATEMQMLRDNEATFGTIGGVGSPTTKNPMGNFFIIDGNFNLGHITDPAYQEILTNLDSALTDEDIVKYADEAQKMIVENVPYMYYVSPNSTFVYSNRLQGLNLKEIDIHCFDYQNWYVTK